MADKEEIIKEEKPAAEDKKVEEKPKKAPKKKAEPKAKKAEPKEEAKEEKPKKAPKKKPEPNAKKAEPKEEAKEEKPKKAPKKKAEPKAKKAEPKAEEEVKKEKVDSEEKAPKDGEKPETKEKAPEAEKEEKVEEKPKKASRKKAVKEEGPFPEELMFGKYNVSDVIVEDPGLARLINLEPALVPHSSARHANKPFYKAKISIVERLINGMMRTEKYTGKKTKSYKVVFDAFEIILNRTKENPIQILVRALENSAPREEVTRLKFGGISVPKSVDSSPSRRLDTALRNICVGTIRASHKNKKHISQCLATELLAASNRDMQSFAVSKKEELERVAKSAH